MRFATRTELAKRVPGAGVLGVRELWAAALLVACQAHSSAAEHAPGAQQPPGANAEAPGIAPVQGNPFEGETLFVPPYTNADQARRKAQRDNPAEEALLAKIADTPQARWFGNWSGEIATVAANYVTAAQRRGKLPVLVAYNIPNRDCGQYSSGGAQDPESYRRWIQALAKGITRAHKAVVILEPDALALLTECLAPADQAQRLGLLKEAVTTLEALPGVSVYIDAGHSRWVPAEEMAARLQAAGVERARGFALNVSNYQPDAELFAYGSKIVSKLPATHYIIDSSRNGNGPTADNQWCNPQGRALGRPPTSTTGQPHLDAFVWVKNPGESDGECADGPAAGQWFQARALEMARNAKW